MRKDLTDITLIVDRSGSMQSCKNDAEVGINNFIEKQKKESGDCLFSLIQFNAVCETIHNGIPIKNAGSYSLVPSGMTALFDTIGKAINEAGKRFSAMAEDHRPGLVIVCIMTDGEENSSLEFTKEKIKEMIELQKTKYNWQFTFLGANQDAFQAANAIGIPVNAAANYSQQKTELAYFSMANNVARMRNLFAAGQTVNCSYTDAERKSMV